MLCLNIAWPIEVCYSHEINISKEETMNYNINEKNFLNIYNTYLPNDLNEKRSNYNCAFNLYHGRSTSQV